VFLKGKWDFRRFRNEWQAVTERSEHFAGMATEVQTTGDRKVLPIMGDIAEENGYPLLGRLLREGGLVLKRKRKRRTRHRY